jgi:hypothetical protein
MDALKQKTVIGLLVILLCVSSGLAQDIELLTRAEFDISFDLSAQMSGGSGDGYAGTWYYYPNSDRYIMWFDNGGYNPNLIGAIDVWSYVEIIDPDRLLTAQVSYGWTTPDWSALGFSAPPLPTDMPTTSHESNYLSETTIKNLDSVIMGASSSVEIHEYKEIAYNPQWCFISVNGRNAHVYRQIYHGPLSGGAPDPDPEPTDPVSGACCNLQTGACYETTAGICVSPYAYMGDGSTCADCQTGNWTWDYGDAPTSYGVTRSQNGAKHVVAIGVHLGADVSRDTDGKPGSLAALDEYDDGVQFQTTLQTGNVATVWITASTAGVINAWLDLNLDGDWADFGEQIIVDEPVIGGINSLSFQVPSTAFSGQSYARFRFNTTGGLTHLGVADDGEVEDYAVAILAGSGPGPTPDPGPQPTGVVKSPMNKYSTTFSQPADLASGVPGLISGWEIPADYGTGPIMADDWSSNGSLSIQGIRWWGVFDGWVQSSMPSQLPSAFHIGVWSDNPSAPYPLTLLWETTTSCWAWAYSGQLVDARGQVGGEAVFEFSTLLSQDKWFYPNTLSGTKLWISISAIYGSGQQASMPFGWLTRGNTGTDAAVMIQQVNSPVAGQIGQWPPVAGDLFMTGASITYPANQVPWDMAFELISSQPGGGGGSAGLGGDLNNDGEVDVKDVSVLMGLWLD